MTLDNPNDLDRFDLLCAMIEAKGDAGEDVLLDCTDARLLTAGVRLFRRNRRKAAFTVKTAQLLAAQIILHRYADRHKIPVPALKSGCTRAIIKARHEAIQSIAAECTQLSSVDIGVVMGMHHTSILNALGRLGSRSCQQKAA